MGQENLTIETLRYDVLYQNPVLNDMTIYNVLMIPAEGHFDPIGVDSDYPTEP